MKEGQIIAQGKPEEVITSDLIQSVYEVSLKIKYVEEKPFVITV